MKSVSGKEFAKVFERNGWVLVRIQSSHHIYGKQGAIYAFPIPIHGNETDLPGL
ncbi:MAG: type II toxin-antitoxin system HicA family toxin [Blastocatellia bacterium]